MRRRVIRAGRRRTEETSVNQVEAGNLSKFDKNGHAGRITAEAEDRFSNVTEIGQLELPNTELSHLTVYKVCLFL